MKIKTISYAGMFAALIFIFTMFVKLPVASGYLHPGDALVYLSALLLGPWGILAGVLGEGLADVIGGYTVYAPATVLIKGAEALLFLLAARRGGERLMTKQAALLTLPAGAITVGGYFLADLFIARAYAFVDLPGNVVQAVGSAVIFVLLAAALDKAKIRERMSL